MKNITKQKALGIALKAIEGKVRRKENSPVEITCDANVYTVTFVHETPTNMLGADFDAQVRIDAITGEVLQLMVGP